MLFSTVLNPDDRAKAWDILDETNDGRKLTVLGHPSYFNREMSALFWATDYESQFSRQIDIIISSTYKFPKGVFLCQRFIMHQQGQ
jgi:hypothetical protein